jgi:hypothetical protein
MPKGSDRIAGRYLVPELREGDAAIRLVPYSDDICGALDTKTRTIRTQHSLGHPNVTSHSRHQNLPRRITPHTPMFWRDISMKGPYFQRPTAWKSIARVCSGPLQSQDASVLPCGRRKETQGGPVSLMIAVPPRPTQRDLWTSQNKVSQSLGRCRVRNTWKSSNRYINSGSIRLERFIFRWLSVVCLRNNRPRNLHPWAQQWHCKESLRPLYQSCQFPTSWERIHLISFHDRVTLQEVIEFLCDIEEFVIG